MYDAITTIVKKLWEFRIDRNLLMSHNGEGIALHYELNYLYEKADMEYNYLCSNWEWFTNGRAHFGVEDDLNLVWLRINQN